ncbi:MAG: prolipoprotein diacylglyceryl transferase [Clostridiales bacterium]|nr:prolipoprotein diacylglyceryl transferase [Clostridiales bacterium]
MYPRELFLGLNGYELCLVIGMVSALFLADLMAIKAGFSIPLQRHFVLSTIVAILVGIFGAALFQAFYNFLETGIFDLMKAMTFYGGLIFGAGAFLLMWFALSKPFKLNGEAKKQFPCVASMAAVLIPMAHGFGRIGCLLEGCCHGKITNAWFGVPHYGVSIGGEYFSKAKVVPIQLFEALFLFALAGVLFWLYMRSAKRRQNRWQAPLLSLYMVAYGVWRFVIEFFRADDRGETIVPFLTPSQLIALLLIIGGIVYIFVWYFTRKRGKITETSVSEENKENSNDKDGRDAGV